MSVGHKINLSGLIVGFVSALLLGIGISMAGMTDGRKMERFFNLTHIKEGNWDPSLGIVFAMALIPNWIMYRFINRDAPKKIDDVKKSALGFSRPIFDDEWHLPSNTTVDMRLISGGVLFGAGWSLSLYCPGPGLVGLWNIDIRTSMTVAAMLIGWGIAHFQKCGSPEAVLTAFFYAFAVMISTFVGMSLGYELPQNADITNGWTIADAPFSLSDALIGGALIGFSVFFMLITLGEVLGISGIISGVLLPDKKDKSFRFSFVAGLLAAGFLARQRNPGVIANYGGRPVLLVALGGLLVGYGTGIANGCTSGHGIAGLSRSSIRSVVAVAAFFISNLALSTTIGIFA